MDRWHSQFAQAFQSVSLSADAAGESMRLFGVTMNAWLAERVRQLTPVQRDEYFKLVEGGTAAIDALILVGTVGSWSVTKRAADR